MIDGQEIHGNGHVQGRTVNTLILQKAEDLLISRLIRSRSKSRYQNPEATSRSAEITEGDYNSTTTIIHNITPVAKSTDLKLSQIIICM